MNQVVLIFILLACVIPVIFHLGTTLIPKLYTLTFPFSGKLHVILEIITSLVCFLIFYKANNIFSKTNDRKMLVIAGGFLAGGILQIYHFLVSKVFPYDVLTESYALSNPHLLYVLIGRFVFPVAVFGSILINVFGGVAVHKNLRRNIYLAFLMFAFFIIVLNPVLTPLLLYVFQNDPFKLTNFSNSLDVANNALFLLTAFIYLDVKLTMKEKLNSPFILGLILLGTGQLFFLVPVDLVEEYSVFFHMARFIGFFLIFLGLKDIFAKEYYLGFRQKLLSLLSLFLIISYLIFVSIGITIANIEFPTYAPYFFLEIFIITITIQYVIFLSVLKPFESIIKSIDKYKPKEKPEKIPVTSNDEIGILADKINLITEANWNYTQDIIARQELDKIKYSLINSIRSALTTKEIEKELVSSMGTAFNPDSCLLYNYDKDKGVFGPSKNEYRKNFNIPSLINIEFKYDSDLKKLYEQIIETNEIIVEKNIEESSLDEVTKSYFRNKKISSFLLIPLIFKNQILGILAFYNFETPYDWKEEVIEMLRTIEPQISLAFYQARIFEMSEKTSSKEQILRENMVAALGATSFEHTLKTIVNKTGKLIKADRCFFFEYDANENEFLPIRKHCVYLSGLDIKDVAGRKFYNKEIETYTNFVIGQNQLLVINNVDEAHLPEATRLLMDEFQIKSLMMAPIIYANKPIGALVVDSVNSYREYSDDEVEFFRAIAEQASILVYQSQLYFQVEEKSGREELLRKITTNIFASEDIDKALTYISSEISKLFDADKVNIRFYQADTGLFTGAVGEYRKNIYIQSEQNNGSYSEDTSSYIFKRLFIDKELIVTRSISTCKCPDHVKGMLRELNTGSVLIAPVTLKGEPLAAIIITNSEEKNWDSSKFDLLQVISQQISIGINIFKLNENLKLALENEKILRKISSEATKLSTHEEIDDYLLNQLLVVLKVDKVLHFHLKKEGLFLIKERVKTESIKTTIGEYFIMRESAEEIVPSPGEIICLNDVEKEVTNSKLLKYLLDESIQSCMIYPTTKSIKKPEIKEVIEVTLIALSKPYQWSSQQKSLFKLMIESLSLVSLEVMQKNELENTRNTFIATLTHDLRSPIIAEQKALEFMITQKPSELPQEYGEYLEDIYNTNEDLLNIVNNLLSVYHIESGRMELNKTKANLPELIDESVRSLKYLAKEQESEITVDITEPLPEIFVDHDEIKRVLVNLVGNALKHTRKGTKVEIHAYEKNNNLQVAVKDNGQGISREQIPLIFQRYPTKKRKVGTGLGLFLSKQIIEAHGGRIWFETIEGKGTTFYFMLYT